MITDALNNAFPDRIRDIAVRNDRRITVTIDPDALLSMTGHLYNKEGFRFIIASANHTRRGFEIYYHFSEDETGLVLNLHVILDSDKPEVESLSNMFEATNWIEREMHELYGISFRNHPTPELLLSEGNWATGEYPYRRNFKSNGEEAK